MEETPPEAPKFNMPQVEPQQPEKVPDAPLPSEVKEFKPQKSKKKLLIIVAILVALIAGGAAAWYFFLREDDANEQAPVASEQSSEKQVVTLGEADTVPYAFKAADADFYSLFWRDAAGGERTEVGPLASNTYVSQYIVSGQNVAYTLENSAGGTGSSAVWYSSDAGKTYEQTLELSSGDQVTSIVFSTDNSALAVAVAGEETGNKVSLIDLKSKSETGSYTSDQRGVFLEGYDAAESKILYFEGCYNCDGNSFSKLNLRDISDNTVKVVADAGDGAFTHTVVKSDFSEVIVTMGTMGGEGLGASAPYDIQKINLSDGSKQDIGSVPDSEVVSLGYQTDGVTPYYAYGNVVVSVTEGGDPLTLYESESAILNAYYVSKDRVIASTGAYEDYMLQNYDITAGSATTILSGDNNAIIFGVTTK